LPALTDFIATHKRLLTNKKLKVRELDEESKGKFVAFVDDGIESYDVQISLDDQNQISLLDCDCDNKKPCVHLVFLADNLAHINEPLSIEKKRKSTKKLPEYYHLIDSIDEIKLKDWLKSSLDKDKEMRLVFFHAFKEKSLALESIQIDMLAAIKSVTNNRKKPDASVIKKLLDLFAKINAPLYLHIQASKDIYASILMLYAVFTVAQNHYNTLHSKSKKYEAYIHSIFPVLNDHLIKASKEEFINAINVVIQNLERKNTNFLVPLSYLITLIYLVNEEKIDVLLEASFSYLKVEKLESTSEGFFLYKMLLTVTSLFHRFEKYAMNFSIYSWENEFNLNLIKAHIEIKKYSTAENIAQRCIQSNYKIEYSLPYLNLLKNMYKETNDIEKYLDVAKKIVPYTFDYDDYLETLNSILSVEDKIKYRTRIYSNAISLSTHYEHPAYEFCYKLLIGENKHAKLQDLISKNYGNYQLINKYFDDLQQKSLDTMLDSIFKFNSRSIRSFNYGSKEYEEKESLAITELISKISAYFPLEKIKIILSQIEKSSHPFHMSELTKQAINYY